MKKIILITAIAVCSISSYAQVSFGAQVGANLGMGHTTLDYVGADPVTNNVKVGFLIGVLAEIDFGKIAFRPELNFVQKGGKNGFNYGFGLSSATRKLTLNYIDIPLNVVYKMNLGGKDSKLFFGLGPDVGIGLSGNDSYDDTDGNGNTFTKHKVKFDGKKNSSDFDTHLKRVDIGLNILAGYQLPMGVFGKIGYTLGFPNLDPNDDQSYKNRGVSICIGYMLGGKKSK